MYNLVQEKHDGAIPLKRLTSEAFAGFLASQSETVKAQIRGQGFEPEPGKILTLCNAKGELEMAVAGVRDGKDPRATLLDFADYAANLPADAVYRVLDGDGLNWQQAALGWGLATYSFDRYKKKKRPQMPKLEVASNLDFQAITHRLEAMFLARDLVNTPASHLGPRELADAAARIGEMHGADVKVIEDEALLADDYPAIYAVGKGSERPPLLIDLRWGDPSHPKLTLVGKGVVFDTGGMNLKGAAGMLLMKKDMGGGAVTLALAQLIMSQGLPVRLRLLIPAVENTPGPRAYRPSDVIETRKGLSVEIGNTDAEGRVILCDALAEAVSESPDLLIDMATLTGAARVALGQDLPGFWTPSETIAQGLLAASAEACDPIWRMPLWEPYRENLESQVADLNNMANTPMGGSITAALYLYEFVKPYENWVHFDAYCWRKDAIPGTPKGGEASALRAIYQYLENRFAG